MARKRRLIGRLVAAYVRGRDAARRGDGRHRLGPGGSETAAFLAGHDDERARMHLHRKLPQYELELFPEAADADGP